MKLSSGLLQHVLGVPFCGRSRNVMRLLLAAAAAAAVLFQGGEVRAADAPERSSPPRPPSKFKDFNEVVQAAQKMEGLFTLYRTNDNLYAEIKPNQFNQPFIAPIAIARGMAMAGQPLNFGDEWILVFRRVEDRIQLLRRNIHYTAPEKTPLEKAVKQNYTDSVLLAIPIVSERGGSVLIDFANIFFTDFANLRLGALDRNRTSWHQVKAFANNLELEVEATYTRGGFGGSIMQFGESGVVDSRGMTIVIHYSLAKLPEGGYKPRVADNRVGQFISATKNFGSPDPSTAFVRNINRWRLEKADPKAPLSPPKKQIVWWVEDTVPHEFRPFVEEGILEWNKAFEKIGYRNALGVRWQNERDDFDPEDINYCTFRWITTSSTFAMSGLRANPITGEMIDGDVIFDASWIRYWKDEYALLVGAPVAEGELPRPLAMGEIISPIMAVKNGFGLPFPLPRHGFNPADNPLAEHKELPVLMSSSVNPLQLQINRHTASRHMSCQFMAAKQREMSLAAMAMAAAGLLGEDGKLPDTFLAQAIKEVVMHEVGHSLGLRHNFKASTMLALRDVNDTSVTRVKGMAGSVMDYNPINIARKGEKQGDYATTTIGPYDYWAIEYAYKPIQGDEAEELKKIAVRSPEPDLTYATDEDMYLSNDPYVNAFDLGSDPLEYGKERIALAAELLKDLDSNVIKDGQSWARLRRAFSILLGQYGDAAFLASGFIGGQSVSRDFKGENAKDPVVPVPGDKQREALSFLVEKIFSDKSFDFSAQLLRRLTTERWYHWGNEGIFFGGSVDYPIHQTILAIQRIALDQCLNSGVLARVQNQSMQAVDAHPLRIDEIFSGLTEGIWAEIAPDSTDKPLVSTIRRNLQREYVQRLAGIVLGDRASASLYGYVVFSSSRAMPADARSLARLHLDRVSERVGTALEKSSSQMDDVTRAHLRECQDRIKKVLEADYSLN